MEESNTQLTWKAYAALAFACLFFTGLTECFPEDWEWIRTFDFQTWAGKFGCLSLQSDQCIKPLGSGGTGAKGAFLFSLGIIPCVMLAMGVLRMFNYLRGDEAAARVFAPLSRSVFGIPGKAFPVIITSLQSTDAGALLTKELEQSHQISERQRYILAMWQFSAAGTFVNIFSSGVVMLPFLVTPVLVPISVIILVKLVGANLMRFLLWWKGDALGIVNHD